MQKLLLFIATLFFIAAGCNNPNTNYPSKLFSTDSLQTQNYTININADTLLATASGAWLKIDKGTFSSENNKVVLEIKEAYSIEQIIKAGLTTQSNGQPLSSGGMIYINAAAGQKVTVNKPFKIAVPSNYLDKDMQLFKGEPDANKNINWINPAPIDTNLQMSAIQKGEILFQQKCASCHGIGKEGSGPDLANLYERFGREILGEGSNGPYQHSFRKMDTYTNTSITLFKGKIIDSHDTTMSYVNIYECNLISLYGNKEVYLQEDFNKNTLIWQNIYDYIENESKAKNLPLPRHSYLKASTDSCRLYEKLKNQLEDKKLAEQEKRKNLIEDNGTLVDKRPDPTWQQSNSNPPPPDFDKKVRPNEYNAVYYQFTIETFGWYNIDMLLNKKEGVEESELLVRIVGAYKEKIKIYLVIPSVKVYGEGGPTENKNDEYAFFNKSGTIPLPQNTKAYVLAVTETENSIAFGLKEFVTQTKQTFEMELQSASKKEFDKAIQSVDAEKLKITVAESKHAAAIKEADKTIKQLEDELKNAESLKPKNCDCDCGKQAPQVIANEKIDSVAVVRSNDE